MLIDEYQDTNKAQYAIARGLSIDQPNLCVVGDPDQSIYNWRGSDIRNILDFERDFPDARVITLERNYRSTKAILDAANSLIATISSASPRTSSPKTPPGAPVRVLTFETGQHEAEAIARRRFATPSARAAAPIAISPFSSASTPCRGHWKPPSSSQRVPYQIVRGLAFFERKENKDVLAYLRLLLNPRDDLSFLRVVNEPARGIGKVSLEHLRSYAEPRELSLLAAAAEVHKIPAIKGKAQAGLRDFARSSSICNITWTRRRTRCIRQVIDRSGYRAMLDSSGDAEDAGTPGQHRGAHHRRRASSPPRTRRRTIADFLENVTLASDVDGWDENQDCVSIMTLHAAKGLEFPVVYMVAVEQGLLPHERSLDEPKSWRRNAGCAFVGMTRAKEELYLCHARLREFRGQTLYAVPSMFLGELPDNIDATDLSAHSTAQALPTWRSGPAAADAGWLEAGIPLRVKSAVQSPEREDRGRQSSVEEREFVEGMLVKHDAYGTGRVVAVGGYGAMRTVKIRFSNAGERSFRVEQAKLTIVRS